MKIITDNAVYVQNDDLIHLTQNLSSIPASVFLKIFGNDVVIVDNSNRFDFVKFETPEHIEFFKNIEWIIDFYEIKDLTESEIIESVQNLIKERNEIITQLNSMTPSQRKKHMNLAAQLNLLDFKTYSLRNFLWFKQGHLEMQFPKEVELPEKVEQKKDIRKLIKNIFKKKKN